MTLKILRRVLKRVNLYWKMSELLLYDITKRNHEEISSLSITYPKRYILIFQNNVTSKRKENKIISNYW